MICPKCGNSQTDVRADCSKCGIYFFKYERAQQRKLLAQSEPVAVGMLWQMSEAANPLYRVGRGLLLLGIAWLSWQLIFSPVDYWQGNAASRSFLHNVNLPFHEAGHLFFSPLGSFMQSLGGTLGQLLMPMVCCLVLLLKTRDAFGAAVAFWWFAENFLDSVSYINDASKLNMPLLGGNEGSSSPYGFHDWEFILTEMGLVNQAQNIASVTHNAGSLLMLLALLWMLLLLLRPAQSSVPYK